MWTYIIGVVISYFLSVVYLKQFNKHKDTYQAIIMGLLSWLGVFLTIVGMIVVLINESNTGTSSDEVGD